MSDADSNLVDDVTTIVDDVTTMVTNKAGDVTASIDDVTMADMDDDSETRVMTQVWYHGGIDIDDDEIKRDSLDVPDITFSATTDPTTFSATTSKDNSSLRVEQTMDIIKDCQVTTASRELAPQLPYVSATANADTLVAMAFLSPCSSPIPLRPRRPPASLSSSPTGIASKDETMNRAVMEDYVSPAVENSHPITLISEQIPSELVPSELVPSELVPSELVSSELVPSELVSSELVSSELVPSELVSSELVSSELVSSELVPSEPPYNFEQDTLANVFADSPSPAWISESPPLPVGGQMLRRSLLADARGGTRGGDESEVPVGKKPRRSYDYLPISDILPSGRDNLPVVKENLTTGKDNLSEIIADVCVVNVTSAPVLEPSGWVYRHVGMPPSITSIFTYFREAGMASLTSSIMTSLTSYNDVTNLIYNDVTNLIL